MLGAFCSAFQEPSEVGLISLGSDERPEAQKAEGQGHPATAWESWHLGQPVWLHIPCACHLHCSHTSTSVTDGRPDVSAASGTGSPGSACRVPAVSATRLSLWCARLRPPAQSSCQAVPSTTRPAPPGLSHDSSLLRTDFSYLDRALPP